MHVSTYPCKLYKGLYSGYKRTKLKRIIDGVHVLNVSTGTCRITYIITYCVHVHEIMRYIHSFLFKLHFLVQKLELISHIHVANNLGPKTHWKNDKATKKEIAFSHHIRRISIEFLEFREKLLKYYSKVYSTRGLAFSGLAYTSVACVDDLLIVRASCQNCLCGGIRWGCGSWCFFSPLLLLLMRETLGATRSGERETLMRLYTAIP